MDNVTTNEHKQSKYPLFVIQEDRPGLFSIALISFIIYIVFLFTAYPISKFAIYPTKIVRSTQSFHEQVYIETNKILNTDIVPETFYYGTHSQLAAQEQNMLPNGKDPILKGEVLSQKITEINPNEHYSFNTNKISQTISPSQESFEDFFKKSLKEQDEETIISSDSNNKHSNSIGLNHNNQKTILKQYIDHQISSYKKKQYVQIDANLNSTLSPLRKSNTSVAVIGKVSMTVQGSEFGEYEQQLLEAISYNWQLLSQRCYNSLSCGEIVIQFTLNSDGTITDLKVNKYTSSDTAVIICSDAINSQSPFLKWTNDMISKFGNKKLMVIKFIYF